jgi:hypothetical protein
MMPDPKGSAFVKAVGTLATQKAQFETKVKELLGTLDAALRPIGYRVVPVAGGVVTGKRRGRPPGSRSAVAASVSQARRGRKRGRKAMSAAERSAVSRRMKAYWSKRKKAAKKAR